MSLWSSFVCIFQGFPKRRWKNKANGEDVCGFCDMPVMDGRGWILILSSGNTWDSPGLWWWDCSQQGFSLRHRAWKYLLIARLLWEFSWFFLRGGEITSSTKSFALHSAPWLHHCFGLKRYCVSAFLLAQSSTLSGVSYDWSYPKLIIPTLVSFMWCQRTLACYWDCSLSKIQLVLHS